MSTQWIALGRRVTACREWLQRRLSSPQRPFVIADGHPDAAKRTCRLIRGTSLTLAASLGATLPEGLVIVVQRVAHDGRQLNGTFQVFDCPTGGKRYLLELAQSVNGRQVSDEELLAALRVGLVDALEDQLGRPVRSRQIDLEVPRARSAPVVPIRPDEPTPVPPRTENSRSPLPIQRIENNNHAS